MRSTEENNNNTELSRLASLEAKVANLDSAVARMIAKMEMQVEDRRIQEQTLRNIDNNVKSLSVQMAASSGERHKETEVLLHPLWEVIRKHDSRFHECGATVKKELRDEAKSHLALVWVGLMAIVSLAIYIYSNDRQDVKNELYSIVQHIDRHHSNETKRKND